MTDHELFLRARVAFAGAVMELLVAENAADVTSSELNLLRVARELRPTLAKLMGEADVTDFILGAAPIVLAAYKRAHAKKGVPCPC